MGKRLRALDTLSAPALAIVLMGMSGVPPLLIVLPTVGLEEGAVLEKLEAIVDGLFLTALEDGLELLVGILDLQPEMHPTAKLNF
jgi:hypothetical protein